MVVTAVASDRRATSPYNTPRSTCIVAELDQHRMHATYSSRDAVNTVPHLVVETPVAARRCFHTITFGPRNCKSLQNKPEIKKTGFRRVSGISFWMCKKRICCIFRRSCADDFQKTRNILRWVCFFFSGRKCQHNRHNLFYLAAVTTSFQNKN